MRQRPPRPGWAGAIGVLTVAVLVSGCVGGGGDAGDTDVAGVVIERDEPPTAGTDPIDGAVVAAGPAEVGITWTAIDGEWVGLGARTLTDDGDTRHLALDVAVDDAIDGVLRATGCELALQAADDGPLVVRGDLEAVLVIESPTGDVRRIVPDPAAVDVVLAPGELYRAALPTGDAVEIDAATTVAVRCEGRFSPT